MGKTKKILKDELKNEFDLHFQELTDAEQQLTHDEKKQLREYLIKLGRVKLHAFDSVLIKRYIRKLIDSRKK